MRTVSQAMTSEVVTVHPDAPFKQVVQQMLEHGIDALPVVDERGTLQGIVSGADLTCHEEKTPTVTSLVVGGRTARSHARKARGRTAAHLMSRPVQTAAPREGICEALAHMNRAKVGRLVVVDEGRVVGVLTRSDLLRTFLRSDEDLARDVEAVVRAEVGRDHAVDVRVADGVVLLRGTVQLATAACAASAAARAVAGVVDVENDLVAEVDDLAALAGVPGI